MNGSLSYLIVSILVASHSLHAAQVCEPPLLPKGEKTDSDYNETKDPLAALRWNMHHQPEALRSLKLSAAIIQGIHEKIGRGSFAAGVFRIDTLLGKKVLKLYSWHRADEMATAIFIQNAVAESGIAPKIHGILDSVETTSLLKNFPQLNIPFSDPKFGVIMDEVPEAWDPNIKLDKVPAGAKNWPMSSWESQIEGFAHSLQRLHILPGEDFQFLVDQSGRLWLVDFDVFKWIDSDGKIFYFEDRDGGYPKKLLATWGDYATIESDGTIQVHLDTSLDFVRRLRLQILKQATAP